MTATMATLHDLSIIPVSRGNGTPPKPRTLIGPCTGGDTDPILREMQQRLSHRVWEQAALHYHGLGAENGVNMTVMLEHQKQLVARGAHVRAGMLYKIATAQIYDGSRVCEHDPDAQVACVLCGSPGGSMFHRINDCPCIPASFELDKKDRIVDEERTNAHSCPIFWFRGLPPRDWYPELPVAEDPFVEVFGSLHIMGGHVFTDGSGGALRPKTPASGAAVMVSHGSSLTVVCLSTLGGRAGILHGTNQSVARAELLAAVEALRLCQECYAASFSFGPMVCLSSTASPEGDVENTCPALICGRNSGKLTTPSALPSLVPQGLEESRHRRGDCCRAHFTTGSIR